MKKQNFADVMRGDPRELSIYLVNDYSAHKISFGVKAGELSNMLNLATADILIQKLNSAAGGDDDQITATYANGKTKITVKLEKDDTQDFTEGIYSYDITVQPADNSTEPETIAIGELAMIGDVQTDYDGTDLPSDAERYVAVLVSDITDGYFVKRSGASFVGYDLASVISASHSHSNKALLDTYTQSEANLASAVSQMHTHANAANIASIDQNLSTSSNVQFANLTLTGTLTVQGTTVTVNATTVTVADNLILLNKDEVGAGVTNATAGIEIERGSLTNYQFIFDEVSDLFKVGMVGSLQAVATREDTPIDTALAFWNATQSQWQTSNSLRWNGSQLSDGTNAVSIANLKTAYDHTALTNNPHTVTATQVGLGNVTNESKATMFTSPTFTGTATASTYATTSATILSVLRSSVERASLTIDENSTGLTIKTVTDLPVRFGTTNAIRWRIQYGSGKLLGEQTANFIGVNTVDGSDTGYLSLSGSSEASVTRGASISLYGNESTSLNPSYAGDVHIFSGVGGQVWIGYTTSGGSAQDALGVQNDGSIDLYGNVRVQTSLAIGGASVGSYALAITGASYFNGVNTNADLIRMQSSIQVLNKAQTTYLALVTRDITGSEVAYNFTNVGTINAASVVSAAFTLIELQTPPASAGATGTAGTIIFGTDGYLYLCTAANTWVRTQLTTWS